MGQNATGSHTRASEWNLIEPAAYPLATDEELGEVPHIRSPIKIGEDVRVRSVAPKLGQHNAEIFGQLGVTEAEMRELRTRGVL